MRVTEGSFQSSGRVVRRAGVSVAGLLVGLGLGGKQAQGGLPELWVSQNNEEENEDELGDPVKYLETGTC